MANQQPLKYTIILGNTPLVYPNAFLGRLTIRPVVAVQFPRLDQTAQILVAEIAEYRLAAGVGQRPADHALERLFGRPQEIAPGTAPLVLQLEEIAVGRVVLIELLGVEDRLEGRVLDVRRHVVGVAMQDAVEARVLVELEAPHALELEDAGLGEADLVAHRCQVALAPGLCVCEQEIRALLQKI